MGGYVSAHETRGSRKSNNNMRLKYICFYGRFQIPGLLLSLFVASQLAIKESNQNVLFNILVLLC